MKNQNKSELKNLFSSFLSNLIIKTIKQAHQVQQFNLEKKNFQYEYRLKINDLIDATNALIENQLIQRDKRALALLVKLDNAIKSLMKTKGQIEEKIVNAQNVLDEIYKRGYKVHNG